MQTNQLDEKGIIQMTNEFTENQTAGQIVPVSLEEIKKALFEQVKEFEFSPQEYIPGPDSKKMSIFTKIANIMGALDRIPKTGHNTAQNYYYVTESDVTGAVRPLMAKEKLIMMPSIKSYKVEEIPTKYSKLQMGTIEIEWVIRDADSYEVVKFTMIGKGTDTAEKDIYKAITGNKKYALITLFMMDSGDDPERDDNQGAPGNQNQGQNRQNQGQNRSNNNSKGNTSQNNSNANTGNSGQNTKPQEEGPPQPPQPSKPDLLTRWITLSGTDKPKTEVRKAFDDWYKKKVDEKWDNLTMMQVLTKKLHEKNQAEKAGKADQPEQQDQPEQTEQK